MVCIMKNLARDCDATRAYIRKPSELFLQKVVDSLHRAGKPVLHPDM